MLDIKTLISHIFEKYLILGPQSHNKLIHFDFKNTDEDKEILQILRESRSDLYIHTFENYNGETVNQVWYLKEWNEHKGRIDSFTAALDAKLIRERALSHRHSLLHRLMSKALGVKEFSSSEETALVASQAVMLNKLPFPQIRAVLSVFVTAGTITENDVLEIEEIK